MDADVQFRYLAYATSMNCSQNGRRHFDIHLTLTKTLTMRSLGGEGFSNDTNFPCGVGNNASSFEAKAGENRTGTRDVMKEDGLNGLSLPSWKP